MEKDNNEMKTTDFYDDNYSDTEEIHDSKDVARSLNNMADLIISSHQVENKGKLLAHYESAGLSKTYIDVYERAMVGRMKDLERKTRNVAFGYANIAEIEVEGSTIYFKMKYREIYCIRHLKMAEKIVCQIKIQKHIAMEEW